jgi:UDP-N-acetylglucosamine 4,6-dehydratase
MTSWLENKKLLVTGGAGAFGKRFLRSALAAHCARVTVFSRDEMKHAELKRELGPLAKEVEFRIGDVLDPDALRWAIHRSDLVVHAAAMKHLPECEANPEASTRVNVVGTRNVTGAFLRSSAEALVFLSTDKAPYASSVYGAQKYLGEKLIGEVAALAEAGRRAFSLRYSNVMDSTGSVFHVFRRLLLDGQTANVNGAQTSRGFVTQAEVIRAVESGLALLRGGEVLVLPPRVVRIGELAEAMRKLLGKGRVNVVETPGFVGEKESATLVMGEERAVAREISELPGAIMLDFLARHPEHPRSALPAGGLTLENCPPLAGAELESFLAQLL